MSLANFMVAQCNQCGQFGINCHCSELKLGHVESYPSPVSFPTYTTLTDQQLKDLVKEAVREALAETESRKNAARGLGIVF